MLIRVLFISVCFLLVAPCLAFAELEVEFVGAEESFSASGQIQLEWQTLGTYQNPEVELERANNPEFDQSEVVFTGAQTQLFLSGFLDGHASLISAAISMAITLIAARYWPEEFDFKIIQRGREHA